MSLALEIACGWALIFCSGLIWALYRLLVDTPPEDLGSVSEGYRRERGWWTR